jgi:glyoxylase-like metal-dependent hydrolase (beta-lactamase superfamily II)
MVACMEGGISMSDVHEFQLGAFRCWIVSDGQRRLDNANHSGFVNASDDEMRAAVEAYSAASGDPANVVGMNILVVDTGSNRVIVDTGDGVGSSGQFGNLMQLLPETGLTAADIDTVIITHGHGDHINACTNGSGVPNFPNAQYVISQPDWEYWTTDPGESAVSHLLSIGDRFDRIATDAEIVPGIRAVPAPGHTPGQIALLIESDGQRLLHVADAWHHPVELPHPEWYFSFDWDPEQTVATRRRLLDMAARDNLLVLPYHATFPGLGHVIADGDAWRWQPVG